MRMGTQYDTKVLLKAIAMAVLRASTTKEAYNIIAEIANAEGVLLKPYDEAKKELDAKG